MASASKKTKKVTKTASKAAAKSSREKTITVENGNHNDAQGSSFRVRQLDDVPVVEPLNDDQNFQDYTDFDTFEDSGENMDVSYERADDAFMEVRPVEKMNERSLGSLQRADAKIENLDKGDILSDLEKIPPKDILKVRFGTFVDLITNHNLEEVIDLHADKDIIMEANLLTALAASQDQREERRVPLVFLVGIALGVVLTYIFFST